VNSLQMQRMTSALALLELAEREHRAAAEVARQAHARLMLARQELRLAMNTLTDKAELAGWSLDDEETNYAHEA
jgi:hypothetical protein